MELRSAFTNKLPAELNGYTIRERNMPFTYFEPPDKKNYEFRPMTFNMETYFLQRQGFVSIKKHLYQRQLNGVNIVCASPDFCSVVSGHGSITVMPEKWEINNMIDEVKCADLFVVLVKYFTGHLRNVVGKSRHQAGDNIFINPTRNIPTHCGILILGKDKGLYFDLLNNPYHCPVVRKLKNGVVVRKQTKWSERMRNNIKPMLIARGLLEKSVTIEPCYASFVLCEANTCSVFALSILQMITEFNCCTVDSIKKVKPVSEWPIFFSAAVKVLKHFWQNDEIDAPLVLIEESAPEHESLLNERCVDEQNEDNSKGKECHQMVSTHGTESGCLEEQEEDRQQTADGHDGEEEILEEQQQKHADKNNRGEVDFEEQQQRAHGGDEGTTNSVREKTLEGHQSPEGMNEYLAERVEMSVTASQNKPHENEPNLNAQTYNGLPPFSLVFAAQSTGGNEAIGMSCTLDAADDNAVDIPPSIIIELASASDLLSQRENPMPGTSNENMQNAELDAGVAAGVEGLPIQPENNRRRPSSRDASTSRSSCSESTATSRFQANLFQNNRYGAAAKRPRYKKKTEM